MGQEDFSIQSVNYQPLKFSGSSNQPQGSTNPIPELNQSSLPTPINRQEAQDLENLQQSVTLANLAKMYYTNPSGEINTYGSAYANRKTSQSYEDHGLYGRIRANILNEGTQGAVYTNPNLYTQQPSAQKLPTLPQEDQAILNKLNNYAITANEDGTVSIFKATPDGQLAPASPAELRDLSNELGKTSFANTQEIKEMRQIFNQLAQAQEMTDLQATKQATSHHTHPSMEMGMSMDSINKSLVLSPTVGSMTQATDAGRMIDMNNAPAILKIPYDGLKTNPIMAKQLGGGMMIALGGILFTKLLVHNGLAAILGGTIPAALGMYFIKDAVRQSQNQFP